MSSGSLCLRIFFGSLTGSIACLAIGLTGACTGTDAAEDAAPSVCWQGGGMPSPGVEVEVGTGVEAFEPFVEDQELILHAGAQGGGHFFLNALTRGLSPGTPRDSRAGNPTTLFQLYYEDGENVTAVDCAYPYGYEPAAEPGAYQLPAGRLVQINRRYFPSIYGRRVRISVQVLGADGLYATDERTVTVGRDPFLPDAGVPDAGAPDAGPDAGTPDAARAPRR